MTLELGVIKVADLRNICRRTFRITTRESASRKGLYEALGRQPESMREKVHSECLTLIRGGYTKHSHKPRKITRSNDTDGQPPFKRRRHSESDNDNEGRMDIVFSHDIGTHIEQGHNAPLCPELTGIEQGNTQAASCGDEFMAAPAQEKIDELIAEFIDATGNAAMTYLPCCSCSRDLPSRNISNLPFSDVPNKHLLRPTTPHNAQTLYQGMVMCPEAISRDGNSAAFCDDCLSHLKDNQLPPLSLANDMWIGDVPYQLSNLSIAERIMIAKGFPSAYIVKLYPKRRGAANWDRSQFHNGLKGNVSTYRMNPAQLADVVINNEFPHDAKILSATIGVTFVGPKGVRVSNMPDSLRVRRWRIRDALQWLKENNPLYADITISENRLSSLPEEGIPEEILSLVKYSNDTYGLNREHEGYVPEYDENEGEF